jgi:hypothetical protein
MAERNPGAPLRIGKVLRKFCLTLAVSVVALRAAAQAPAPVPTPVAVPPGTVVLRPIEVIPDTSRLSPAELPYAHPLFRPLDEPAKLAERPPLEDLETRVWLYVTVKIGENGRVSDGAAVEPPLKALTAPLPTLFPRWRFTPALKGGQPVATWGSYAAELNVQLEKGVFSAFTLVPVGKEDPLPRVVPEPSGESWMLAYSKEITPADPGTVSVEACDTFPMPDSNKWSFDTARTRSRVTALVQVSELGKVARILPTGETTESLVLTWLKKYAATWHMTPAMAGGKPVSSWMALDATLEYTINSAKKKSERTLKKNLRAPRAE